MVVPPAPIGVPPRHLDKSKPLGNKICFQITSVEECDDFDRTKSNNGVFVYGKTMTDYSSLISIRNANTSAFRNLRPDYRLHLANIYGRTEDGRSVMMQVEIPLRVVVEFPNSHDEGDMQTYFNAMKEYFLEKPTQRTEKKDEDQREYVNMDFTWHPGNKPRACGYFPDPNDKTKAERFHTATVSFKNLEQYKMAIEYFERPFVGKHNFAYKVSVWETIKYIKSLQRFLIENKVVPCSWIEVENLVPLKTLSAWTDYECKCSIKDITPLPDKQSICKTVQFYFDIETINGLKEQIDKCRALGINKFPDARDPTNKMIQLSITVLYADGRQWNLLLELDDSEGKTVCQRSKRKFEGIDYDIWYCKTELEMLLIFRDIFVYVDPDIESQFNGNFFDWRYLYGRLAMFSDGCTRFAQLGRRIDDWWEDVYCSYRVVPGKGVVPTNNLTKKERETDVPKKSFPLTEAFNAPGVSFVPILSGRISLDLCEFIRKMSQADGYLKFKNYTLNNMASRFLKDNKLSFDHNDIFDAWNGSMTKERYELISEDTLDANPTPEMQRLLLGNYCVKDTLLLPRIMKKLGFVTFLWQLSRVTMTPPYNVINNGQMQRVNAQFITEAWSQGRYINMVHRHSESYEGAKVIESKRGYYGGADPGVDKPLDPQPEKPEGYDYGGLEEEELLQYVVRDGIGVADFASLYPSIMRTDLLCISNLMMYGEQGLSEAQRFCDKYNTKILKQEPRKLPKFPPIPEPGEFREKDDGHCRGVITGFDDDEDFTTVCIVQTNDDDEIIGRRFHRFNKHDEGCFPVMLGRLLSGRKVYKKKLKIEKYLLGGAVKYEPHGGEGEAIPDDSLYENLRELVAKVQSNVQERNQLIHEWLVDKTHKAVVTQLEINVNVFDGRQKALKVSANSIYGSAGVSGDKARNSPSACFEVAESTTAIGQQLIAMCEYVATNNYKHYGCKVVYGDTDSIFVHMFEPDDDEFWRKLEEIAGFITKDKLKGTVHDLEAEKIYRQILLRGKKNYAGACQEDVKTKIYKPAATGLETVRRDKPKVLTNLMARIHQAYQDLGHFQINVICRLLLRVCIDHFEKMVDNEFPIGDYSITQRINETDTEGAHILVARKLQALSGTPINRGDAVEYIFCKGSSKLKASQKAQPAALVRKHPENYVIDRAYYLDNRIKDTVTTTLELFMPPEVLQTMFAVYNHAMACQGIMSMDQMFRQNKTKTQAQIRSDKIEQALDLAIKENRMPRRWNLVGPKIIKQKRVTQKEMRKRIKLQTHSLTDLLKKKT